MAEDKKEKEAKEPVINSCPDCGEAIDVAELPPFSKIECPHCDEPIRVRTILGNYQILELLGEGGMSQVFKAKDLTLNRDVALKILHENLSRDTALMAQFEREAQLTASINHPNVVKVYTVGSDQGYFFIAMELIDNVSLEKQILDDGALSEADVLEIAHGITNGLRAAFQRDLIHRDIKPGNILLTSDGTAKLVDFGLAVVQGGDDETEDIWATPFYVPPEKLDGQPDDFRGDIYSLGATFYHTLAGHPPFEANTAHLDDLIEIKAQPISLAQTGVSVSQATIKLIDRMMAYKPSSRHQKYEELLRDIEGAQDKLPASARAKARRSRAFRQDDRTGMPGWLKWGGLGVTALIAIALLISVLGGFFDTEIDADLGGNSHVLTAGQKSAATRYVEARNFLVQGQHKKARILFGELLESGALKEPTASWAQFNSGLAALMAGDEKQSRAIFTQLLESASARAKDIGGTPLDVFFANMSFHLTEPLPVMPDAAANFKPGSVETVALLSFGLKNWSQRQFDSAMAFLEAFEGAEIPKDYPWLEKYREMTVSYRRDFETIRSLPNPKRSMPKPELEAAKTALTTAIDSLETSGAAPELAKIRIRRADELLALASQPPPSTADTETAPDPVPTPPESGNETPPTPGLATPPEGPAMASVEAADRDQLRKLLPQTAEAVQVFDFGVAKEKIQALDLESPLGGTLKEDHVIAFERAGEFVNQFVEHLSQATYQGTIRRKEGPSFDAKITAADHEKIEVDLGFGPNDLPIADLAPDWMLTVAEEGWLNAAEPSKPESGAAIWFAWSQGLQAKAESYAAGFDLPPFQARWTRVKDLGK